jgi:hypothetical protein
MFEFKRHLRESGPDGGRVDGKHTEWSLKVLKQIVKIKVLSPSEDVSSMIRYYEQLLDESRSVDRPRLRTPVDRCTRNITLT